MKELTDEELTSIWREANNFPNPKMSPPLSGRDSLFAAMRLAMEKARNGQKEFDAVRCDKICDSTLFDSITAEQCARDIRNQP